MFLLTLLFAVVIPLTEGALLALLLREVYIRHPLPLGGTIGMRKIHSNSSPSAESVSVESSEVETSAAESIAAFPDTVTDNENNPEASNAETAFLTDVPTADVASADSTNEDILALHSGVSVFDGTENIPENLPIGNLFESMTADDSVIVSSDLENRIEASALPVDEIPEELHSHPDDLNSDHLQALAEALAESLPRTKIDFSQELETNPEQTDSMSPMAKELLGVNFDFDALEQQSAQAKQSFKFLASVDNTDRKDSESFAASMEADKIALDVQENGAGTVQVSSPFVVNTVPQLTDFTAPEMILSSFSSDWIQEMNSASDGAMAGEPAKFCFTEELRPMFVRKKKDTAS